MILEKIKSLFPYNSIQIQGLFGVLFFSLIGVNIYFIYSNQSNLQGQIHSLEYVDQQKNHLSDIEILFQKRFSGDQESKIEFDSAIQRFSSSTLSGQSSFGKSVKDTDIKILQNNVDKGFQNIEKILNVISAQKVMGKENQEVLQSRLHKEIETYLGNLNEWKNIQSVKAQKFTQRTQKVMAFSGIGFILLILGYQLLVIKPLMYKKDAFSEELSTLKQHLDETEGKAEGIRKKTKETEALLKVKTAQVLKLQESLELAIAYSTKTQQDKNLIYFNVASDLSNYCKVLNLQKKIIENQTSMPNNENWMILTNTISQIHSLAGDYFKQAKNHVLHKDNQEIYLAPFLSEVILSLGHESNVTFEQLADLPSIKTNSELLKRVLQPFMGLITEKTHKGTISYSARLDGVYCEFKFFGLDTEFEESLAYINKKNLSDYSFDEFKIHMAEKVLRERGGKAWIQLDSGKAVFTIYWPL